MYNKNSKFQNNCEKTVKKMELKALIFDENALNRAIVRISHQITEKNEDIESIVIIGIHTRGVPLAKRLSEEIFKIENHELKVGTLDITMHRDDIDGIINEPIINKSDIKFDITGKTVILVDDVIYTGRTVRSALDAVMEFGRPARIQLAVMIDRGHRELPIRADYVGKNVPTSRHEIIKVNFKEVDGKDSVELYEK